MFKLLILPKYTKAEILKKNHIAKQICIIKFGLLFATLTS